MAARSSVLVAIPAWNESGSIAGVLQEMKRARPDLDVVVIDDSSTDDTAAIAAKFDVSVITLPFNVGVGGAMRAGFRFAQERGYSTVVQIDADGQHVPEQIQRLLQAMHEHSWDIVIGSRYLQGGVAPRTSVLRLFTMKFLAKYLSLLLRKKITDGTSGFRASGQRAIDVFSRHYPHEYLGDTIESLVIASKLGMTVGEVPVTINDRSHGKSSQSSFRAAQFTVRAFVVLLLAVIRVAPDEKSTRG
ncbi:MAG: glycosyltransferase [Actinobacteria bacterium]|uniref:Unannotated protein n=1 Tax=freshwater metagenome TaxID=449393 RepID=A0A6J5ZKF2_9ZZZZ|nr:glycosyltransferase [Actinomycetota bacterium]